MPTLLKNDLDDVSLAVASPETVGRPQISASLSNESGHLIEIELRPQAPGRSKLQRSEEKYRDFFENAKDAIYVHDLKGRYILVNRAAEDLLGYSKDELLGRNFDELVAPEYMDAIRTMFNQKMTDREPSAYEVIAIRKDGTPIPVEVNSRLIYENGVPVGVHGTARDISERWRHQEALRESEERFRSLFENAKDVIFTCDLMGDLTSINKAVEDITGYSRNELLGTNVSQVLAPECRKVVWGMLARKASRDLATTYEVEIVTRDGRRVYVEVSSRTLVRDGRPYGIQGSARDISARKSAEEALQASQVQLQQSQKLEAIGQLAGGVAHDFNNLLTAIIGYSDLSLLQRDVSDKVRRNLEEIKRAADRATSLTRQLLAFSRKQILEPKILNLNSVVNDMQRMLRRMIGEDIELTTSLPAELGRVQADPGQVEQIIMNLVINARDAMPRGGKVTIETANVTLDETYATAHMSVQPGAYVMLAITDTGIGMDRETQSHVFEPFFTTKEAGKGTGLGLSTVYGIVKQSGGYVWVYSEINTGTCFKVYLPRALAITTAQTKRETVSERPRGSETILLVEDEEVVRRMARLILESAGYKVLDAPRAAAALELFKDGETNIDLMVTDVIMPGMSGRVLAEKVADVRPEIPVIYMSGYTDDAIVRHGLLTDSLEFVQKPFTAESLTGKVREVLDARLR